jgi:S-DNA-T family DNA segregation ATPase FtsK/SpoIIIE
MATTKRIRIRATELRPGKDVGTLYRDRRDLGRLEIVKWFYVEADDDTGYDAAVDVIARALGYLDQRTPVAAMNTVQLEQSRNLLSGLSDLRLLSVSS